MASLCLGTAQLGMKYGIANKTGRPDSGEIENIVRTAWENDIDLFDTAQAYGESEEVLGRVFEALEIKNRARVMTKLAPSMERENSENIIQSVKDSLRKLRIPKLFSLMLHREEWLKDWGKYYQKPLNKLCESGAAQSLGVSIYSVEGFEKALQIDEIKTIQMPFNLFDQRVRVEHCSERAQEKGKLLFLRSVYLQGALALNNREIPSVLQKHGKYFSRLHEICESKKISVKELALSFVMECAPNAVIVIGAETSNQIEETIQIANEKNRQLSAFKQELFDLGKDVPEELINPSLWTAAQ